MMKASLLLLCIGVITEIYAWPGKKCPTIPTDAQTNISIKQIKGNWKLTASKPDLSSSCRNITITEGENEDSLTETYISKYFFFWKKQSTHEYTIVRQVRSPVLELKPKAWYSFGRVKSNLIDADYGSYAIFYTCSEGLFNISETYELWTRQALLNKTSLPTGVAEALKKFSLTVDDLTFRTAEECSY